jgi:hypothetical protein
MFRRGELKQLLIGSWRWRSGVSREPEAKAETKGVAHDSYATNSTHLLGWRLSRKFPIWASPKRPGSIRVPRDVCGVSPKIAREDACAPRTYPKTVPLSAFSEVTCQRCAKPTGGDIHRQVNSLVGMRTDSARGPRRETW